MARTATRTANIFTRVDPETKEQFDAELQKGMNDIAAGHVLSADLVEAEMRGLYGESI